MALLAALPLLILLAAPLALLIINRVQPEFRSSWLLGAAAALITLFVLFYLRVRLPLSFSLSTWLIDIGRSTAAAQWQFDTVSLPFVTAVVAVALSGLAVSIRRAVAELWTYWVPGFAIVAAAVLAVMAANPLALALSWMALDGLVLLLGLLWLHDRTGRDFVLRRFGLALVSTILLIGGAFVGGGQQEFTSESSIAILLFLLAGGLRLGVLPFNPGLITDLDLRPAQWVHLRILPAAASLALLARLDLSAQTYAGWLIALVWLGGTYAAAMWLRTQETLAGLPYWLAGMAALGSAAALLGTPAAAQAAGLAWLLAGGLLALAEGIPAPRWLLLVFGGLSLGALPYTPSHGLMQLYSHGALAAYAFLPVQAMLLFGWLRRAWAADERRPGSEPWAQAIALGGLAILPLVHQLFALGLAPDLTPRNLPLAASWLLGALWLMVAIGFASVRRGNLFPGSLAAALELVFSLRWLYAAVGRLLAWIEAFFDFLGRLLEGQAGVLWALLMITLLLSLILQLAVET